MSDVFVFLSVIPEGNLRFNNIMIRHLQFVLLTLAPLVSAQLQPSGYQSKTIKIQAVDGKSGKPLGHQRLVIFGGESEKSLRFHEQHFDITTDGEGRVGLKLSSDKTNWIQVWADRITLCQSKPNLSSFSVEMILAKGLSAPNSCSSLVQADTPGVFTVYARESTLREKMAR